MRPAHLLLVAVLVVGLYCGCDDSGTDRPVRSTDLSATPDTATDSALAVADSAARQRDFAGAVQAYLSVQTSEAEVLLRRGRYLLNVARFYGTLSKLGQQIRTDMLIRLEEGFRAGGIKSDVLLPLRIVTLGQRGRYSEVAALLDTRAAEGGGSPWWSRAWLTGARAAYAAADVSRCEAILVRVAESAAGHIGLELALHRARVEMGLTSPDTSLALRGVAAMGDAGAKNLALVDAARVFMAADRPLRAAELLVCYDPAAPEATEQTRSGGTRNLDDLEFLATLGESLLELAAADLARALETGTGSQIKILAAHGAGQALILLGDVEDAGRVLQRGADVSREGLPPYVAYLGQVCEALARPAAMGRQPEATSAAGSSAEDPALLSTDEALRSLALTAATLEMRAGRLGPEAAMDDCAALGLQVIGARPRPQTLGRAYWTEAGVLAARVLRQGDRTQREMAVRLLERVHESSGYDPRYVDPGFLLELAHAYHLVRKDGLATRILAGLAEYHEVALPVYRTVQLMVATTEDVGFSVPGDM